MAEIITKTFQSKGGKLVYHKLVGKNKDLTIIYIHGLAPISSLYIEMFADQYHEFSLSEYSFLIPNLIGFGESEKPDNLEVYTMENQGHYLHDLLLSENVHNVIIIAISMGGPVAISLIDKIKNQKDEDIKVKGLFYLEGNLDKNDTFFSSRITKYPFEQFKEHFDLWIDDLIKRSNKENVEFLEGYRALGPYSVWGSAYDIVILSESNKLLPHLMQLSDFPMYFVFGEKNKGRFTSESLVKKANLPIIYIPNAGHAMRHDNPEDFWKVIKKLLKTCF
ncbi:MAG: alpha/beta hydrolase [Candidatus Lokiarchaeota archaeon]|nr:alpha/beta hydrolase [Candidatus Lokiarchaeota archaeon]